MPGRPIIRHLPCFLRETNKTWDGHPRAPKGGSAAWWLWQLWLQGWGVGGWGEGAASASGPSLGHSRDDSTSALHVFSYLFPAGNQ